jgi:aldehyde dehydrogenase (NAD+)
MDYQKLVEEQRVYFKSDVTKTYTFRLNALRVLKNAIIEFQDEILEGLKKDLNKSLFEGYMTEIGVVLLEIKDATKSLKKWMKVRKVKTPLALTKAKSYIYPEPYGVVLIMSPWNYPFQLAMSPLIGAIAAGNTAVIKLSPDAPYTANAIDRMIKRFYEEKYILTLSGGLEESKAILKLRYDYIFFTGSTSVGKIVMKQASEHLIPVTLELGGKSPCIIDETANLDLAAKRIAFGKFMNAGQTCIAPDYIYIKEESKNEFIEKLKKWTQIFFSENAINYVDYPHIINQKHYHRLIGLIDQDKVIFGGKYDLQKIEPTFLENITRDDPIMQEEIFGPLLPILTFKNEEELLKDLKQQEKPLAIYIFTQNKVFEEKMITSLSFGGATINDTLMHVASGHLPFGGVGYSGMGSYHGKKSFTTFTHEKSVLKRSTIIDLDFRYHPYTERKKKIIKFFIK